MATAAIRSAASRERREDLLALYGTIAITVAALILGALLKGYVEGQTSRVERGGVSVEVPAGWIVQEGVGDTLLTAYDPRLLDQRYSVASFESTAGASLADAAGERLRTRGQLLEAFTILEQGQASLGATQTYSIRYAFVESGPGLPVVIEVLEHYVADGGRVLVAGLEAPADSFPDAVPRFERFARGLADQVGR